MYDYKYAIQSRADELAQERYGKDFYDLTDEQQYKLFTEAEESEGDALSARADLLRDSEAS